MPIRPCPPPACRRARCRRRRSRAGARRPRSGPLTRTRAGPACLSAFVSASWTIAVARSSRGRARAGGVAVDATCTGNPARRTCSARAWRSPTARPARASSRRDDAEQPAHLGQRLAAGLLDDEQRLAGALRVLVQQQPRRAALQGHDAHAVRDHVVQVARDPGPLLRHRGARPLAPARARAVPPRCTSSAARSSRARSANAPCGRPAPSSAKMTSPRPTRPGSTSVAEPALCAMTASAASAQRRAGDRVRRSRCAPATQNASRSAKNANSLPPRTAAGATTATAGDHREDDRRRREREAPPRTAAAA